jgi:hypothetical protein
MNHPRGDYSYAPPPNYSEMSGRGDQSRKRHSNEYEGEQRQMKFSRSNNDTGEAQRRPQFANPTFQAPPVNRSSNDESNRLQSNSRKCIAEMQEEINIIERSRSPEIQYLIHSQRLLNEETKKLSENYNPDWLDLSNSAPPIKVVKCVLLPKLNVLGRLFGVGGATLKKVCQVYKCRISIAGSGSRKNPEEERRLLESGDPNFAHLSCPLHAEISSVGPTYLAYTRLANLLTLFHKLIYEKEKFEQDGIVFQESKASGANSHGNQQQFNGMPKMDKPNYEEGPINPRYSDYPAFDGENYQPRF